MLAVRIGLGLVYALRAMLVYGEAATLATEPVPVPRWIERLAGLEAITLPGRASADQPA